MNKRLLAVAVAGALAAPAAAFAQSSVTISGVLKGGFEGVKYSGQATGNQSVTGVVDDSSRIIFNIVEDLGGGLQAIGQYDFRGTLDLGGLSAGGNDHVGLRSKSWGRIFIGRQDLHYFNRESDLTTRGSLRADSISLLAYAGAGLVPIANATRTNNVVHYTTPNWGGFTMIAAYSSNPSAQDADLGATTRKGSAWNLNPNFQGSNFQVGYSYWTSKSDAPANAAAFTFSATTGLAAPRTAAQEITALGATADQRGDRLYGSFNWGGFKVGLAWDRSRLKTAFTGSALTGALPSGTEVSKRTVWSIPVSYTWGAHSINAHYDRAGNDKDLGGDTKSRMFAISYAYDLSKRTSAALTYARINNGANAQYNFFTNVGLGLAGAAPAAGVDPRLWAVTLRHQF